MVGTEAFEIMKVFLDTNIVLDALMERIPWVDEASVIVQAIQSGQIAAYISASSLTDIAYLSFRISKDRNRARLVLLKCLELFEIITINQDLIEQALNLNGLDFEDDLQIISAISAECDAIITRDIHGFIHSPIPVFDPFAFLNR